MTIDRLTTLSGVALMNIHENKLVDYGVLFQQMQKQLSYRMLLMDLIS